MSDIILWVFAVIGMITVGVGLSILLISLFIGGGTGAESKRAWMDEYTDSLW